MRAHHLNRSLFFAVLCACAPSSAPPSKTPARERGAAVPSAVLLPVEAFDAIADPHARARALFLESTKVLLHPRCANCHPSGDAPTQRTFEPHDPPVVRGDDDDGVPGLRCSTCHPDANAELARVPGAPKWKLAPRAMAWVGKRPGEICAQLKDTHTNGGRTLEQVVDHVAHDSIVAWGWHPGADREPVPGTQAELGALFAAWVKDGADCPSGAEEKKP